MTTDAGEVTEADHDDLVQERERLFMKAFAGDASPAELGRFGVVDDELLRRYMRRDDELARKTGGKS